MQVAEPGREPQVEAHSPGHRLQRNLGVWNGVSIIVGVIVGSGIFVSPRGALEGAGSPAATLIVWCLSGMLAMLGALCFAELGTSIQASGGEYTYIKMAYGPTLSFLYLWVQLTVIIPCGNAIAALTFATYTLQPFTASGPNCTSESASGPSPGMSLLALTLLLLLVYINCVSIRASMWLQNAFSLGKVAALLLIMAFGLYHMIAAGLRSEGAGSWARPWANTETSPSHLAWAFYAGFYTFAGWNALNFVTEEMKDPVRNMPRAIILSITSVTFIYILTNAAYLALLSPAEILDSAAIAVTFGQRALPVWAHWFMPLAVGLSTVSGLNGAIFACSRLIFAGARNGQLFSALAMISLDHLSPIPALLWIAISSSFYLFSLDIMALINYATFVEALLGATGVSTLLVLRWKQPHLARPLRLPLVLPIFYLIATGCVLVLPIWHSYKEALIGMSITLIGLPVYWISNSCTHCSGLDSFLSGLTCIIQKLTKSVQTDKD